jgi:C4-dicarboxylate transporter, DctQ subunit
MIALKYIMNNLEKCVANMCLAFLVILLGAQVFARYVLHEGISSSEELSRFSFIWFVYISGSLAAQTGKHIRVTVCIDLLPKSWRRYFVWLSDALWLCFNFIIIISGFILLKIMLTNPMYSASLYISMAWIYAIIPIAHVFMSIRIIQGYYNTFRSKSNDSRPDRSDVQAVAL